MQSCEHFIRTCGALGFLRESSPARACALLNAIGEEVPWAMISPVAASSA